MKNKSIVVLILSILVVLGCGNDMSNTPSGQGPSGQETTSCNISISSYEEFDKIRDNLSCNYTLTANIDFKENTDFEPIGTKDKPFTGVLDGAGHTIKKVTIEKKGSSYVGVIGYAKGATIKKFVVENANVKGRSRVGAVISSVGAVVGEVRDSKIMELSVIGGKVETDANQVGGLVGASYNTIIENSYSSSTVTGNSNVGGLVGRNVGTIENSYATGEVTGADTVGGLVGFNYGGTIENSYATGKVTRVGSDRPVFAGGLVGWNSGGTIENSYATGAVTGTSFAGGLVGLADGQNTIENSYYDKEGTGKTDIGKGIGVSGKANIVKRDNKYYDTLGTEDITTDDVEIFKGWDSSVWDLKAGAWPTLK